MWIGRRWMVSGIYLKQLQTDSSDIILTTLPLYLHHFKTTAVLSIFISMNIGKRIIVYYFNYILSLFRNIVIKLKLNINWIINKLRMLSNERFAHNYIKSSVCKT